MNEEDPNTGIQKLREASVGDKHGLLYRIWTPQVKLQKRCQVHITHMSTPVELCWLPGGVEKNFVLWLGWAVRLPDTIQDAQKIEF